MKERMEKKYSFSDDLVEDLFEDFMEQDLITLPEVERPHEVGKKEDPKYCPYHRLISHPLKECFILKDKIQELLDSNTIEIPPQEKITSNPVTTMVQGLSLSPMNEKFDMPDDEHDGEWVVYESKGMRKKKSVTSKSLNVGHITSKEKPRRSKGSKKKKTKVRQMEKQKEKKFPKSNSEDLVSDELLVQTPRSPVTLKEFMPPELQALNVLFFSDTVNEAGEFSVGCMAVVIISDDEGEEEVAEGSASNPIIIPDSPVYWWDTMINESLYDDDLDHPSVSYYKDSEIESWLSSPKHILATPPNLPQYIPTSLTTPTRCSPVIPSEYCGSPDFVRNRKFECKSNAEEVWSTRKRLRFEDSVDSRTKHYSNKEQIKSWDLLEMDKYWTPENPSLCYSSLENSCDEENVSKGQIRVDTNPSDDEKARIEARREGRSGQYWDTLADQFYRKFYEPRPIEIDMLEPLEIDNMSVQSYDLMGGTIDEKIEMSLKLRVMGSLRPRNLLPSWVEQTPFPEGYELPNVVIYEGHGDPERHVLRFIKQCGETTRNQALGYANSHCPWMESPLIEKGLKAIWFHAMGDLERKLSEESPFVQGEESLPLKDAEYSAKTTRMLKNVGLDPEKAGGKGVAPFDLVLTAEQRKALLSGDPIEHHRAGLGFQYDYSTKNVAISMACVKEASHDIMEDHRQVTLEEIKVKFSVTTRFLSRQLSDQGKDGRIGLCKINTVSVNMTNVQERLSSENDGKIQPAPLEFEGGGQDTVDELREVNLGDGRCQPFTKLMKKGTPFQWDQACQNAFDSIKAYLTRPPVLMSPIKGKPLLLYTTALDASLGALLAQHNKDEKENALHYLLQHEIQFISRADPLKYILSRAVLSGRIAKWVVILQKFTIEYVAQKAVKGQALADFLAAHPIPDDSPLAIDLLDEEVMHIEVQKGWEMYFDGASRSSDGTKQETTKNNKSGIGIVSVTPEGALLPYSFALSEGCSNNEAEYESVIAGLELALQIPMVELTIYGDSQLVVKQLRGEYKVRRTNLVPYHERANQLLSQFGKVQIFHVRRGVNARAGLAAQ
ncbi:hypothetical protein RJ640_009787 [Escallonia rubra]|uniref:RNase H type-1 domain-containing protein n=1 Tax=Escallonia rubra TaxID=112253 RepID=A0AA88UHL9_9ASTE|nr:hypothetical protein RJ640_009787 [Escallonia rubra]